jgi:flagellar M-ring protein FliF
MVDGVVEAGRDGKLAWHERGADELARIKTLVQSASGFDAKRGDTVDVVSMRFAEDPVADVAPHGMFGLQLEKTDMVGLLQSAILGVVVLLALMFVVRPMAMRIAVTNERDGDDVSLVADASGRALSPAGAAGTRALPAPGGGAAAAEDMLIDMANIEGQLRASSMRKLTELVEKHPDESLAIMRGWMSTERA